MQHPLLGLSTGGVGMAPLGSALPSLVGQGKSIPSLGCVVDRRDGGRLLPHLHRERAAPQAILVLAPIALPLPTLESLGTSCPGSW